MVWIPLLRVDSLLCALTFLLLLVFAHDSFFFFLFFFFLCYVRFISCRKHDINAVPMFLEHVLIVEISDTSMESRS